MSNNTQTAVAPSKPAVMRLYATVFSYGGKQAGTDNLIVTVVVSDSYDTGRKDAEGNAVRGYETTLKASMILPQDVSRTLTWKPFQTKNGKPGMSARVSIYGSVNLDRREGAGMTFWLNPRRAKPVVQPDGSRKWVDCAPDDPAAALMIFPLNTRAQGEQGAAPQRVTEDVRPVKAEQAVPVAVQFNAEPAPKATEKLKREPRGKKAAKDPGSDAPF